MELFAAKSEWRARLAKLPIHQRDDLIEQLHGLGRTMMETRGSLPKPATGRKAAGDAN
jgi:hypothetical protein